MKKIIVRVILRNVLNQSYCLAVLEHNDKGESVWRWSVSMYVETTEVLNLMHSFPIVSISKVTLVPDPCGLAYAHFESAYDHEQYEKAVKRFEESRPNEFMES